MNAFPISNRQLIRRQASTPRLRMPGLAGGLAGLAGGVAMMLSSIALANIYGADLWFQLKAIASLALGPAAVAQAGFVAGPVLLGLAMHLAVSVLLGALFGMMMRSIFRLPSDYGVPAVAGLVFGLALWLIAYLAVPAFVPQLMAIYAPAWIMQHIVYGTVTGMVEAALRPRPYATIGR